MADAKAGGTEAPDAATQDHAERTDGGRGNGTHKGKGRRRGGRQHGDGGKPSGKGRKGKQRKQSGQGKRRRRGRELPSLAVLSSLGGIAAALAVGFISGRASGRR